MKNISGNLLTAFVVAERLHLDGNHATADAILRIFVDGYKEVRAWHHCPECDLEYWGTRCGCKGESC